MREIKGHLSLLGLGTLLQAAAQQGARGTLTLTHNGVSKTLFIDGQNASLVMATHRKAALLGQILLREGKVKLQDLQAVLAKGGKGGPRLGELLVGHGLISPDDLVQALVQQSQEEFFDLFGWEEAQFDFREESPKPGEQMPMIPIMGLVLEAARRTDEQRKVRHLIPSMSLVPKRVKAELPEFDPGLNLLIVRSLASYIDDARTVGEILRLCPHPTFETEVTLAGLVKAGAIRLHDPAVGRTLLIREDEEAAAPKGHILVLSDMRTYGEMLAAGLVRAGLSASAHDPDIDAMDFGITRPDGVMLDLNDSVRGRSRLEKLARELGAPIVVLASNSSPQAILALKEAGARDVYIKPVSVEQIVARLRRTFGLERAVGPQPARG